MRISLLALAVIIVDQLSKFIVLKNLLPGASFPIIKNIFHLSLVFNRGVAFGVFSQRDSLFVWISIICAMTIIFILTFFKKVFHQDRTAQRCLALIFAGALGNLLDRIRFGYVVDFLDLRIWPVFNIADSAITIGAFLLLLKMLRDKKIAA